MLNWFDIVVAISLIIAFFNGWQKGLVMQLVNLAGLVIAIVFAGQLAKKIVPWVLDIADISPNAATVAAYILAFAAIMLAATLVGSAVQRFIEVVHINFLNRLLGAVVAAGIALVMLSLVLNLVLMVDTHERIITAKLKKQSYFYEKVRMVVPLIVPYLNQETWEKYIPEKYRDPFDKEREPDATDSLEHRAYPRDHINI